MAYFVQQGIIAAQEEEWQALAIAVDSCATETVGSPDMLTHIPTVTGQTSRNVQHSVACVQTVDNIEERHLLVFTEAICHIDM